MRHGTLTERMEGSVMYIHDLEVMVDDLSFSEVVEMLAHIAYEKAGHVAETYQDTVLAEHLLDIGRKLDTLHLCE